MPPDLKIYFKGHWTRVETLETVEAQEGLDSPSVESGGLQQYLLLKNITSCSGGWSKHVTGSPLPCQPLELRFLGCGARGLKVDKGGEKSEPLEKTCSLFSHPLPPPKGKKPHSKPQL